MVHVEAVDEVEVIRHEQEDASPFQFSRCIHPENDHESEELHQKGRL